MVFRNPYRHLQAHEAQVRQGYVIGAVGEVVEAVAPQLVGHGRLTRLDQAHRHAPQGLPGNIQDGAGNTSAIVDGAQEHAGTISAGISSSPAGREGKQEEERRGKFDHR